MVGHVAGCRGVVAEYLILGDVLRVSTARKNVARGSAVSSYPCGAEYVSINAGSSMSSSCPLGVQAILACEGKWCKETIKCERTLTDLRAGFADKSHKS